MRSPRALCFALAVAVSSLATAGNVDSIYYPDQGKVVLPNLKVGSAYYYVILTKLGNTNDFRLDATSITNLSLPMTFTPAAASDLVGTFSPVEEPSSSATFNANGTYSMIEGAGNDPGCAAGGPESGTYQYDAATGILSTVATSDSNGQCGFSHPDGIVRIKKSGTDLYLVLKENGQTMEMKLIRK